MAAGGRAGDDAGGRVSGAGAGRATPSVGLVDGAGRGAGARSDCSSRVLSGRPSVVANARASVLKSAGRGGGGRCVTVARASAAAGGRAMGPLLEAVGGRMLAMLGVTRAVIPTTVARSKARAGTATAACPMSAPDVNVSRDTAVTAPGMLRFA